jgi:hypothetical protein
LVAAARRLAAGDGFSGFFGFFGFFRFRVRGFEPGEP